MPAKRDTGGYILTEWPFCYVKSAIEHKRRYAHLKTPFGSPVFGKLQYCNQVVTALGLRGKFRYH